MGLQTPSGKEKWQNLNDDRREKHFGRGCKPRPAKRKTAGGISNKLK